jgi:hypothetical protein
MPASPFQLFTQDLERGKVSRQKLIPQSPQCNLPNLHNSGSPDTIDFGTQNQPTGAVPSAVFAG